ncbi:hypothetical protein TTRE_0000456701 [Trichuris trichiura]|uniref:Uncharacterized protein n=1 Tax=Trichuris trichiura TaxID=36087 RepID=A0A077Z7V1_TRITR|nr:hypothetical protein TTRE_0000456701 [Trichuris trichiura]
MVDEPRCPDPPADATTSSEQTYAVKYDLLLKEYKRTEQMTMRIQNRLRNTEAQISELIKLKRALIQRLLSYGDRFMDVCLEIPDLEPGAMVEDEIIDKVADVHFTNSTTSTAKRQRSEKSSNASKKPAGSSNTSGG